MPSVVILHAADDALPARALGEKLRQANLTPVIEKAPGEERQAAVKNAAISIALWSPRSINDAGVAADVGFARDTGKLVHACMQSTQPPADFRDEPWVDLTGWRGEDDFGAWLKLAGLVTDIAGVAPLPPPQARPASGFFQPGRSVGEPPQAPPPPRAAPPVREPPPREPSLHEASLREPALPPRAEPPPQRGTIEPREPEKTGPNMMLIGIVTFLVVALAGGGGYYFWSQSQGGAGAAAAWAELDRDDPAALRAFLEDNPGALRAQAREALQELERTRYASARAADTIEALEAFAADFPNSPNLLAARGRIAELRAQPVTPAEPEPGDPLAPEALNPGPSVDPDLLPPGALNPPPPQQQQPTPQETGPAPLQPVPLHPAPLEPETPEEPDDATD